MLKDKIIRFYYQRICNKFGKYLLQNNLINYCDNYIFHTSFIKSFSSSLLGL